ncbi:hypothetical protein M409DRAFT_66810 [Zasmidium cellare ATCC 36951]|uniref:AMP-dependent synthetase/ligase domain-containing protein n=1 Tax=Zasmidium cellare ATCC 36951 TaxID=1080233 RepID=A0A6A6CKX3_ZASCE|nr:uncharacterized protein M409DRAFT_66810 [Zasmidium cellare ATCC 36951]KAF2166369.1 hypothetical protein M409DRAFT_66810 [Zasmidium cellare ATCC 36951]
MSTNNIAPHEAQRDHDSVSIAAPTVHAPSDASRQVERQDGNPEDPPPRRPGMSDRQYSTHIYTLGRQHVRPLAGGLDTPEQAYLPTGGPELLPAEALVTIEPSSGPKWWNRLRHGVFSTYRRLWTLVLLGNLAALLYCIWLSTQDLDHISYSNVATAVATNLFVGTLMRHEHCVNFLFRIFVALPHWLPVSVRRLAAKIYCYGGIHSACGISGLAWYIYFLAILSLQVHHWTAALIAVATLAGVVVLLLTTMVITSHPFMRFKFHNQWEIMHRFFGWSCIGMIWAQIILIACANAYHYNGSVGHALLVTPAFWFLIAITALIIYPWLRLRRMTFSAEQLSSHAIRLWFNDSKRILPLTVGIRLSTSPMTETHAFATIPNADNAPGFSVLISNSGDWTKRIITNPPAYLWARGAYTVGVLRVAMLFKPIVIVATGSGIGPCLSFLQVHPDWPCRVVWSARFPEATYGRGVMESVFRADPNAVVIDTKKTGKPDLVGIVHSVYKELNAEAVAIISNPMATREVVFELETRSIPAFGAIFDS